MEFFFDGKSNKEFNLKITKSNHLSKSSKHLEFIKIPGRNGEIVKDDGSKNNLTIEIICKLDTRKTKNLNYMCTMIENWLQGHEGYRHLLFSDGIEFDAICVNQIDISKVIKEFHEVKINFSCKHHLKDVNLQQKIILTSNKSLYNNYMCSNPYLKVIGNGDITISINNQELVLKGVEDEIEIDSENMNAYKKVNGEVILQNHKMYSEFPIFEEGKNNISWIGDVERLEIVPRWVIV